MPTRGHLFVVHGRIEALTHDAALIPVDDSLDLAEYWEGLVGTGRPPAPLGWERGWGRHSDNVWLLSIGGDTRCSQEEILQRVESSLIEIAAACTGRPALGRRRLPLVALPVIGIGRTGYGDQRGHVVRSLVDRLEDLAARIDIDLTLVTPEESVYAAAQYARRQKLESVDERAQRLGTLSRNGGLALFLGAGVSVPAGLKTWTELVRSLAETARLADVDLQHLSATDQAELIEKRGRASDETSPLFQQQVIDQVSGVHRPSLVHALLAGLDCREVVTTNYDVLYETAVAASGHEVQAVMPWTSGLDADRWVLKLHGDVNHRESIVLTRRHMVMYDSLNRPSGALLQALLLTRHLLIVGASMTDDNVIRLAHEVQAYRDEHQGSSGSPFGTVLDVQHDVLRAQLWEDQLDWVLLPGDDLSQAARSLELFLDELAIHASQDASWLLDERFSGLLESEEDQALARQARDLFAAAQAASPETWGPLVARLRELGAQKSGA